MFLYNSSAIVGILCFVSNAFWTIVVPDQIPIRDILWYNLSIMELS